MSRVTVVHRGNSESSNWNNPNHTQKEMANIAYRLKPQLMRWLLWCFCLLA